QPHQRDVEPEDRVAPAVGLVVEEAVVDDLLLVVDVLLRPVRHDEVVDALVGGPGDTGVAPHQVEVFLEGAGPVEVLVALEVLQGGDAIDERGHGFRGYDATLSRCVQSPSAAVPPLGPGSAPAGGPAAAGRGRRRARSG